MLNFDIRELFKFLYYSTLKISKNMEQNYLQLVYSAVSRYTAFVPAAQQEYVLRNYICNPLPKIWDGLSKCLHLL